MKITKKQIKELDKGNVTVRELFPDVFKEKFTGWAKDSYDDNDSWMMYFKNDVLKYGIDSNNNWFTKNENYLYTKDKDNRPATEEEVFEGLKNYAVKIGLWNSNSFVDCIDGDFWDGTDNYNEQFAHGMLWSKYSCIFNNGQWAEIIETITKEEAEKQLGKKIV